MFLKTLEQRRHRRSSFYHQVALDTSTRSAVEKIKADVAQVARLEANVASQAEAVKSFRKKHPDLSLEMAPSLPPDSPFAR